MTRKFFKIIFVLFLVFSFCITYVYATDINLNLPGTTNTNSVDNTLTNQEQENPDNTDATEQNQTIQNNEISEDTDNIQADEPLDDAAGETLQPTAISTAPESGLGVTNIINILLITVGVILVLLAIAILIRLKN